MTTGQTIGRLIGHLSTLSGALLNLWAIVRFFIVGNAPLDAVDTALLFIYGSAFQGLGMVLVWFSGGTND